MAENTEMFSDKIDAQHPLFLNSSDTSGVFPIAVQLTGSDNYTLWSKSMRITLLGRDKLGFVNGKYKKERFPETLWSHWEKSDAIVHSWLMSSVSKNLVSGVVHGGSAQAVWDDLRERFDKVNGSRTFNLHKEIVTLTQGCCLKSLDQNAGATKLSFSPWHGGKSHSSKRSLTIQASYSDGGRPNSAGIFVGGFVLGGLVVGALGCVFAPQISKALAGTDKKELMRKLPKFIYDEDKSLEKQRKELADEIDQLNSAIDNISTQLRSGDAPNGAAVNSDDDEATV